MRSKTTDDLELRLEDLVRENAAMKKRLARLEPQRRIEDELRENERRVVAQRTAIAKLLVDEAVVGNNLADALERICEVLTTTLDTARASVWRLSEDRSSLRCLSCTGTAAKTHGSGKSLETHLFPSYFEAILTENRVVSEDVLEDPRLAGLVEPYFAPLGITALMDAGILIDGAIRGIVSVEHIGPKRRWRADEESFVGLCAALVAQLFLNTARKRAEADLIIFKESLENSADAIGFSTPDGRHYYQNKAFVELFGPVGDDAKAAFCDEKISKEVFETIMAGRIWVGEIRMYARERRVVDVLLRAYANKDEKGNITALVGVHTDITDRKRAEEERAKLQAQLNQAQKMESVGRLAGGVAHDFNNMLGVVLGYTDLALADVEPSSPLFSNLSDVRKAAERSAELTRQLLTFARKQAAIPRVLDLNAVVEGTLRMLRRLIGEDIDLVWRPAEALGPVKIDPSQVDQILANLCVNARDAIGGTGRIVIETRSAAMDDGYRALHPEAVANEYALLAVTDNGCGMDEETLSHLFEPFFTTKAVGKGTGLGLATVYGIVRQNDGFIDVTSRKGSGTSIGIFLPNLAGESVFAAEEIATEQMAEGRESVLLVEDEDLLRDLAEKMLTQLGYTVFPAATPSEALVLAQQHIRSIDLLMTDVVMPEMSGRDLAGILRSMKPDLPCLFMSGYTPDIIAQHGVIDHDVYFLQKPFSTRDLSRRLREMLNRRAERRN